MMSTLLLVAMAPTLKWKAAMFTVGVTGNLLMIGGGALVAKELWLKIKPNLLDHDDEEALSLAAKELWLKIKPNLAGNDDEEALLAHAL